MSKPIDETRDLKSEIRVLRAQVEMLVSRKDIIVTEPLHEGASRRFDVSWVHQICLKSGTTISVHQEHSYFWSASAIVAKGYYENGFEIAPGDIESVKVYWLNNPEIEYVGVERK